jgi:hypothetical protein
MKFIQFMRDETNVTVPNEEWLIVGQTHPNIDEEDLSKDAMTERLVLRLVCVEMTCVIC